MRNKILITCTAPVRREISSLSASTESQCESVGFLLSEREREGFEGFTQQKDLDKARPF
jgi:hypothetical protein